MREKQKGIAVVPLLSVCDSLFTDTYMNDKYVHELYFSLRPNGQTICEGDDLHSLELSYD